MDPAILKDGFKTLGQNALDRIAFDKRDADDVKQATLGIGAALLRAKVTADPDEKAKALKEARDYEAAINLIVGTYLVRSGNAAEKALLEGLGLAAKIGLAALV